MAKTTVAPVVRQYQRFDSIAEAKRGSDVQARRELVRATEASMTAWPVNPGGIGDPGRAMMQSQMAQQLAERREALAAAEALSGDELVLTYCADLLVPLHPALELRNSDGSPLARGATMQPIPPGMF
jgi:hypothetical protein